MAAAVGPKVAGTVVGVSAAQPTAVLDRRDPASETAPLRASLGRTAVASWGAYVAVTALVWNWPRLSLDRRVLNWVDNELFTRGPVSFVLAHLGAAPVMTLLVILACAWFVLRWRAVLPAVILALSYVLVSLTVTFSKELLRRPEPTKPRYVLGYSYPSGHAAAATVGWLGFAFCWWLFNRMAGSERRHGLPAVVGVVMVGAVWAMMLVRSAHWFTDMVGGVLLGAACISSVAAVVLTAPASRLIRMMTPRLFATPARRRV